ncbi:MAG: hypothetical protein U0871_27555 [Gemmataceae bacterium]
MTLAETLQARLADWRPAGAGRHTWQHTFADHGWAVHLTADAADVVGCKVWELTLSRLDDPPAGLTQRQWADRIAARVSGLMEPLKVLEVDATRDETVLRSDGPTVRGTDVLYYEVVLSGLSRAVVRRYQGSKAAPGREQVAFAVTHEPLAKLAGDIAE